MMNPMTALGQSFKGYADFKTRATRTEFFVFQLFYMLCFYGAKALGPLLTTFTPNLGPNTLAGFVNLALIIPLLSVQVRRLHDIGWSGRWVLAFYGFGISAMVLAAAVILKNGGPAIAIFALIYLLLVLLLLLFVIAQYFRPTNARGDKYERPVEAAHFDAPHQVQPFVPQPFAPQPYVPQAYVPQPYAQQYRPAY